MTSVDLDHLKKAAALKASEFVRSGMVVGLGTGSTAKHLLVALGEQVKAGMKLRGVPTSQETAVLAQQAGIHLIENARLDEMATDRVWTSCTLILPLREKGAAGSAVRPGRNAVIFSRSHIAAR